MQDYFTLMPKRVVDLFVSVFMGTYDPPKEDQPFQKLFLLILKMLSVCVLVTYPYMPEGAHSAYGFQLRMQLTLFLVVSHTTTVYRGALNGRSPFNSLAQHFHTPGHFNSTLHAESGEHVTLKIWERGLGTCKITSH